MSQDRSSTRARVVVIVLAVATLASGFYFAGKSGSTPDAYSNDFNVYYHAAREITSAATRTSTRLVIGPLTSTRRC